MLDDTVLDQVDQLEGRDGEGLLRAAAGAGAAVRLAARLAGEAGVQAAAMDRPRALLVCGNGESVLAGRALAAVIGPHGSAPVVVHDDPVPPAWVGAADAVLVLSSTGEDEASLLAADLAIRRGAAVVGAGAADSALAARFGAARAPYVGLPADLPGSTGLWPLLAVAVVYAEAMQLLPPAGPLESPAAVPAPIYDQGYPLDPVDPTERLGETVEQTADTLDLIAARCRPGSETFVNPAKTLATELSDATLLTVADTALTRVAADRCGERLLALVGLPAAAVTLPGGLPVVLRAVSGPLRREVPDLFRDRVDDEGETGRPLRLLLLEESEDPAARRLLLSAAEDWRTPISELAADGGHPLVRFASLVQLLDFAVAYLAIAQPVAAASES